METETRIRLFGISHAFDHPVTVWITSGIAVCILVAWLVIRLMNRSGKLSPHTYTELKSRTKTWIILFVLMFAPILLGAAWVIGAVTLLSILCYREFARSTGLFRQRSTSAVVVLGILLVNFAVIDHWYGLFVALPALVVIIIASLGILPDRPKGYIQRISLGVLSFLLFGVAFGHLSYIANDQDFRPILLLLLVGVEFNDVFAYLCGKSFGRRKLAPNTSPNKTIGGALGAIVCTSILVASLGHLVFADSAMDSPMKLIGLGLIVSISGQLGDLMLSSIKRDLDIKDMGKVLPGHGGLLDRFDSLIIVTPAFFHYIGFFRGFGLNEPVRLLTGG